MKIVTITGINNAQQLDDYFASSLVDIAYLGDVVDGKSQLLLDVGYDLEKNEDREWFISIIRNALDICDESQAVIEIKDE